MNEENNNQPDLTQQLNECLNQKDEWKDRCLRTAADFENYKKRAEKERSVWVTSAQSSIFSDLLSIVDDFDRAFAQAKEDQSIVGFALIHKEFHKFLDKHGISEIKDATQFDPNLHEAIMNVESADHQSGTIVQVLQKGYMFKGQVLRPAKVSVAK
jgi:molecular chaperone GrpE